MTVGARSMSGCSAGLSGLAMTLSLDLHLGKPVIDASGLTGRFHYLLTARSVAGPAPASSDASDPRHSSLVTALEEQLGLKLEARRTPVDVLVVESIQRPTEN